MFLKADEAALRYLSWTEPDDAESCLPILNEVLRQTIAELEAYFRGELTMFTVPLALEGTPFRLRVWQALQGIPYGETRSYAELAASIGKPLAARAVGGANHHNPIAILVPCHRVIGKDGSLTGFGGGMEAKRILLALEKDTLKRRQLLQQKA